MQIQLSSGFGTQETGMMYLIVKKRYDIGTELKLGGGDASQGKS